MYKLLIVDDEEIERRAIEFLIKKNNKKISTIKQVVNGQEAVAIASVFEPNIIIMDINMPGLNGVKAASVIKKFLPDSRIIILTAFDEFEYAKQALKLGADDFVVKPAGPDVLSKSVEASIKNFEETVSKSHQYEHIEERLKNASEYLKTYFIESMISGDVDSDNMKAYLSFFNMEVNFSYGIVISFDQESPISDADWALKEKLIQSKLEKEFKKHTRNYIFYSSNKSIFIYIYDVEKQRIETDQERLEEKICEVIEDMHREYAVKLVYGIGNIVDNVDLMWRSFKKAKDSFNKNVEIIIGSLSSEVIEEISKSIIAGDMGSMKKHAKQVQQLIYDEKISTDDYKLQLLELSILLKQNIMQNVNKPITIDEALYLKATKVSNESEGLDYLLNYLEELVGVCNKEKKGKNETVVAHLVSYIEKNISDNITLKHLSEISKLSTSYISRLFTKHFEMKFSDYLTYLRINKAKVMLKNPYLSVKEISHELGYTDQNYFTRVFKKETGLSPTEYRKQNLTIEIDLPHINRTP